MSPLYRTTFGSKTNDAFDPSPTVTPATVDFAS